MLGLKASMAAAQLQSAAAGAGAGAVPGAGGGLPTLDSMLWSCDGSAEVQSDDELEFDGVAKDAEEPVKEMYWFRACVHCGERLPKEEMYVIAGFNAEQAIPPIEGPVPSDGGVTQSPVWNWAFEQEVAFTGRPVPVEFQIRATRSIGGPALVGVAKMALRPEVGEGARRRQMALDGVTRRVLTVQGSTKSLFRKGHKPTITVVYHLVRKKVFAPSLGTIASLGPSMHEMQNWNVDLNLKAVACTTSEQQVALSVSVRRPLFDIVAKTQTIQAFDITTNVREHAFAYSFREDYTTPIVLQCTRATLMEHLVEITLHREGKPAEVVGRFRENLHLLYAACESRESKLLFDAVLSSDGDAPVAIARVELDIFCNHAHPDYDRASENLEASVADALIENMRGTATRMQAVSAVNGGASNVQVRVGLPREALWDNPVLYSCLVYADGLILPEGGEICNPIVKIRLGDGVGSSIVKDQEANNVFWQRDIAVKAKVLDRIATVSVYNALDRSLEGATELMAQATIPNVRPGSEFWLHCYGGAPGGGKPGTASMMTRGVIGKASTYRGTVVVAFTERKLNAKKWCEQLASKRKPAQLIVRIHRGCIFSSLAGKKVTILVQVAGCRMPDHRAKGNNTNPRHYNRNLLAFPGQVDAGGMLRLGGDQPYHERKTPAEIPLMVPPNALFAYMYIVEVGASKPPSIFAPIRIANTDEECSWQRFTFDSSVVDLPEAQYQSDIAGFLLCNARLKAVDAPATDPKSGPYAITIPDHLLSPEVLPSESSLWCYTYTPTSLASPGEATEVTAKSIKKTMYFHIDILCARNLPEQEPGTCRPRYEINIMGKMLRRRKGQETRGTDPMFMHRAVIPVEIDDDGQPLGQPLPPALIKMIDDPGDGIFDAPDFEIGTTVIESSQVLKPDASGAVDPSRTRLAWWCALDTASWSAFDPTVPGGCMPTWAARPRVLIAAGWAETPDIVGEETPKVVDPNGYFVPLKTENSLVFDLDLALLGMRELPDDLLFPELVVSSFWETPSEGPLSFRLKQNEGNPNFGPGDLTDFRQFRQKTKRVMKFINDGAPTEHDSDDEEEARVSQMQRKNSLDSEHAHITTAELAMTIRTSSLCGDRILAPYKVAIIDYLQAADYSKHSIPYEPFTIMPNLKFELRNYVTGHSYGFAAVPLQRIRRTGDGPHRRDWSQVCADETGDLVKERPELCDVVHVMDQVNKRTTSISASLDVFSGEDGYVLLDSDVRVGRPLKDTLLFVRANDGDDFEEGKKARLAGQYFNQYDFLIGNALRYSDPYDEHVAPTFKCESRSSPEHKAPRSVKELFHACEHLTKNLPPNMKFDEFIKWASTSELYSYLKKSGWRSMTHLAAPEPDSPPLLEKAEVKKCLNLNTHTFVRAVGHMISLKDRDSMLVARLRMCKPIHLDVNDPETNNFLTIKCRAEGRVIWCAPESVDTFSHVGQAIMVIEPSDGSGEVIIVRVPSLDLRFPLERCWVCSKTLRERGGTVQKMIDVFKAAREEKRSAKVLRPKPLKPHRDEPNGEPQKTAEEAAAEEHQRDLERLKLEEMKRDTEEAKEAAARLADGYRKPVYVRKNGFVMRLCKATEACERRSTTNWYHAVLSDAFPEVAQLFDANKAAVKDMVQARLMNLCLPMHVESSAGNEMLSLIKGHLRCMPRDAALEDVEELDTAAKSGILPVDNLWVKFKLTICVNLLSVHDFDAEAMPTGTLTAKVILGDKDFEASVDEVSSASDSGIIRLYTSCSLEAHLPGPCKLRMELWDEGLVSSSLWGTAMVDIEDRWYLLQMKQLRARSEVGYLERVVWPQKKYSLSMPDSGMPTTNWPKAVGRKPCLPSPAPIEDANGQHFRPTCPPPELAPVETLDVINDVDGVENKVGRMRAIVDMRLAESEPPLPFRLNMSGNLEVRISVSRVTNIQVFCDGERNDLWVNACFKSTDLRGVVYDKIVRTDVHKYAVHEASFNHRWLFPIKVPTRHTLVEFTLWDEDAITGDDLVYCPKELHLDEELQIACERAREGNTEPVKLTKTIIFDEWQGKDEPVSCYSCCTCCCRWVCPCCVERRLPDSKRCAKMEVQIEIVTQEHAEKFPSTEGQYRTPEGRLSLTAAAMAPKNTFVMLYGPKRMRNTKFWICCCGMPIFCTLVLIVLVYLLSSVGVIDVLVKEAE